MRWLVGILAIGAVAVLGGWLAYANLGHTDTVPVLRIGSQKGGTKSLMLAAGVLERVPYRIEWSEFPSAQTLLEALGANAIDAGQVGDAPFIFGYASGLTIKAINVSEQSGGGSTAILVPGSSAISSVSDLRGKRIATGRGSIGHYLLLRAMERAGLGSKDLTVVYMNPSDAKAAFSTGAIDAWATWGPYIGLAVLHDHARVLVDGTGYLSGIGFEAANTIAIAQKRALLLDFLHRLGEAERWSRDHPDKYADVLAKETGLPTDVTHYEVAQALPLPVPVTPGIQAEERTTAAQFASAGIVAAPVNLDGAFDPSFNSAVAH